MISFDQHLAQRYADQHITEYEALQVCHDAGEFRRLARLV
jgi:Tfp pilus assembly ATPase PilU